MRVEGRNLGWLLDGIVEQSDPNRRLTLFRIALHVWLRAGRHRGDKECILAAVHDAPALLDEFRRTLATNALPRNTS